MPLVQRHRPLEAVAWKLKVGQIIVRSMISWRSTWMRRRWPWGRRRDQWSSRWGHSWGRGRWGCRCTRPRSWSAAPWRRSGWSLSAPSRGPEGQVCPESKIVKEWFRFWLVLFFYKYFEYLWTVGLCQRFYLSSSMDKKGSDNDIEDADHKEDDHHHNRDWKCEQL